MVKLVAKTAKGQIRNITKWPRTALSKEQVVEAFGGCFLELSLGEDAGPPTLLMIRQVLMTRLQSTGGLPCLAATDKKPKISMSSEDWNFLEGLARKAMEGVGAMTPSPAQLGGVLMHWAITQAKKDPELSEQALSCAVEP
jgi:hypothetical protein